MAAALKIGSLFVSLGADTKGLEEGERKANKHLGQIEKSMDRLRGVALKLGAALAAAFTINRLLEAGRAAVDTMAKMHQLAQALGVTTESFSSLSYAAEQSGANLEQFSAAARGLNRVMQEAVGDPLSRGAEAFRVLGISVTDTMGQLRTVDEVMLDLADRFRGYADGTNKTAIAMQLLGDEGIKLVPMLNQGSEGIRRMQEEAVRLGFALDSQTGESAVRFQQQMNRLNSSFQGIVNQVIQNVLPQMEQLATLFEDLKNDTDRLNQAVRTGELVWKALATVLILTAGAILAVLEGARGLVNMFSTEPTGVWQEDVKKLKSDFEGLLGVIDVVKQSLDIVLAQGAEAAGRLGQFAAPGLLGGGEGDNKDKPAAPRVRSTAEMSKDMEALRGELDLVLDRLNGLPNAIGEAYTINVTGFQDAINAIDKAVMQGVMTQQQATRMKLQLTQQEQNAYKQTAQVAAQAITQLFPKSKAAAMAAAIINTAVAVTEALKLPPPLNFVQAGLVAAAGAAQIATIASTNMSGGGGGKGAGVSGGGGGGGSIGPGSRYYRGGENPRGPAAQGTVLTVAGINPMEWFNGDAMRDLAERLVQHQKDGGTVVFAPN